MDRTSCTTPPPDCRWRRSLGLLDPIRRRCAGQRWASEFVQVPAALLSGFGVEHAHDTVVVQLHAGEDLGPERYAFHGAFQRAGQPESLARDL
jgi:hypothetical protein